MFEWRFEQAGKALGFLPVAATWSHIIGRWGPRPSSRRIVKGLMGLLVCNGIGLGQGRDVMGGFMDGDWVDVDSDEDEIGLHRIYNLSPIGIYLVLF